MIMVILGLLIGGMVGAALVRNGKTADTLDFWLVMIPVALIVAMAFAPVIGGV